MKPASLIKSRAMLQDAVERGILHMRTCGWADDDTGRALGYRGKRPGCAVAQVLGGRLMLPVDKLALFNQILLRHGFYALSDAFDGLLTVNVPRPEGQRDGDPTEETIAAVEGIGEGSARRCGAAYRRAAAACIGAALDVEAGAAARQDRLPVPMRSGVVHKQAQR